MSVVMDQMETFLLNQEVRGLAKEFCPLDIPDEAKKKAILAGLKAYEPGMKVVAMRIVDGQLVSLSASHPRLGLVEVVL